LRLALAFAAMVGASAPEAAVVAAEETRQVAGTGGAGVRLRDEPGLDGGILLVVPEGATVALAGAARQADGREWAAVRYASASGWVAAVYLRGGDTPVAATAAPPAAAPAAAGGLAAGGQAVVTGTGGASLRIRADASLNAAVVGYAPFGATVAITAGPRGEWYGVRHGGVEGWASGRFLAPGGSGAAPQPAANPAPASGSGSALVATALRYLGVPYAWGGASPAGWDCSGFVVYVYREVTGRTLPRTTQAQWGVGTPVARDAIRAGDLVFFQNTYEPGITHVGFALGDGRFVHASAPGVGTVISSLSDPYWGAHYAGARRV
jgi:cell wall-associated NlpC family hydrolase